MVVAFIGHRKVKDKEALVGRIYDTLTELVENEGADTFLFGDKGEFDKLCHIVVTEMQKIYPHIRRVYVRAEKEEFDKFCEELLLKSYEETYYPDRVRSSHELCYVLRNACMIECCDVLLTYCDPNYEPPRKATKSKKSKSGTQMAVEYAKKRKTRVINLFEN